MEVECDRPGVVAVALGEDARLEQQLLSARQ